MSFFAAVLYLVILIALCALAGAVLGLIPFFVGKYGGKPNLGVLGWKWCMGTGASVLFSWLTVPVAIGFVVAILVRQTDYYPPVKTVNASQPLPAAPVAPVMMNTHLGISCLNGPLKGQTYRVGPNGVIIGRDHDCGIRFASDAPGISRHHCSLRWQQGVLTLTDLNSAYGTYMADGRKLPPQYPTQLAAGSRFYLANSGYLFQVVITG